MWARAVTAPVRGANLAIRSLAGARSAGTLIRTIKIVPPTRADRMLALPTSHSAELGVAPRWSRNLSAPSSPCLGAGSPVSNSTVKPRKFYSEVSLKGIGEVSASTIAQIGLHRPCGRNMVIVIFGARHAVVSGAHFHFKCRHPRLWLLEMGLRAGAGHRFRWSTPRLRPVPLGGT